MVRGPEIWFFEPKLWFFEPKYGSLNQKYGSRDLPLEVREPPLIHLLTYLPGLTIFCQVEPPKIL